LRNPTSSDASVDLPPPEPPFYQNALAMMDGQARAFEHRLALRLIATGEAVGVDQPRGGAARRLRLHLRRRNERQRRHCARRGLEQRADLLPRDDGAGRRCQSCRNAGQRAAGEKHAAEPDRQRGRGPGPGDEGRRPTDQPDQHPAAGNAGEEWGDGAVHLGGRVEISFVAWSSRSSRRCGHFCARVVR
jgi:hypothetical protein